MIEYLTKLLWDKLWIFIIIMALISYITFKLLPYKNSMDDQEKENNDQLFFISMAGSIGLGNLFVVMNGVRDSGPSMIVWMWIGALLGRFLKFWEIYLSLHYKKNINDFTGPVVYSQYINKNLAILIGVLSLIYWADCYQWVTMINIGTDTIIHYIPMGRHYITIIFALLSFIGLIYSSKPKNFLYINKIFMKIFLWGYWLLAIGLFIKYYYYLPSIFIDIFKYSIFNGNYTINLLAITSGLRIAIYSNDIGTGFEGIMQKYSNVTPNNYIAYSYNIIKSGLVDLLVCTISGLIALMGCKIYNINYSQLNPNEIFINIFHNHLPYNTGHLIYGLLIFFLAFSTISTLCQSGMLTLQYLKPQWNAYCFYGISGIIFFISLFFSLDVVFNYVIFSGGLLVFYNMVVIGIYLYKIFIKKDLIMDYK